MQTVSQNTEVEDSPIDDGADEAQQSGFTPFADLGELLEDAEEGEDAPEEDVGEADEEGEEVPETSDDDSDDDSEEVIEDDEAVDEEEETTLSSSLKAAAKNTPQARDYSKYDKDDAKYLKQMSNEAFEHFSKQTAELKELRDKAEQNSSTVSADHPDAYVLSDDYRESYANYSKAQQEQAHWREQLLRIRKGESWQNIEGYDKSGQLVLGKSQYKPTQQSELDVELAFQEASSLTRKFSDNLNNVSDTYQKTYNNDVTLLTDEQKANFAWLTDEAVAAQEVVLPNIGSTTINDVKKTFANALPKTFRKHPLAELASNLFVTIQLQAAQSTAAQVKSKEAQRKEPKAKRKSAKASDDSGEFDTPEWMNI